MGLSRGGTTSPSRATTKSTVATAISPSVATKGSSRVGSIALAWPSMELSRGGTTSPSRATTKAHTVASTSISTPKTAHLLTASSSATVASSIATTSTTASEPSVLSPTVFSTFWCCLTNLHCHTLDRMLFAKKTLGNLEFAELYKTEVSEGHWDVNISHRSKGFKVILDILLGKIFCDSPHKDLVHSLVLVGVLPLLAFWNLDVAPSTIDHVSLEEHLFLDFLVHKSDEAKSLGLPTARALLQLYHVNLAEGLKVFPDVVLAGLPGQAKDNQVVSLVGVVVVVILVVNLDVLGVHVNVALRLPFQPRLVFASFLLRTHANVGHHSPTLFCGWVEHP